MRGPPRLLLATFATFATAATLHAGCRDRPAAQGLPAAGQLHLAPTAPAATAPMPPAQVEAIARCVAEAAVDDAARLRVDETVTAAIEAYAEAPVALRRVGLVALARAAQARLAGGRALAHVALALADAGATSEATTFAGVALDQLAADTSAYTFGATSATADAARALARAGAHAQLAALPTTEPQVLAAIAAGHAQAGDTARAEAALRAAADAAAQVSGGASLGAALAWVEATVWLGQIDQARAVVAKQILGDQVLVALTLARAAIDAGRADAATLVADAHALLDATAPMPSAADERARARDHHLGATVALARLRLRAGDRAGALTDLDALSASISEPKPGLAEAGALAEAARVAAAAGDDARAQALIARAAGGSLGDVHAAPAASIDRLSRRGEHRAALDVVYGHAGFTSSFYATIFARAAAGPVDPALAALLQQRVCRSR